MKKCIIWGMGKDYELLLNQILFEIHKGNIEVTAIVCREKDKYCSKRDGFDVITKNELGGNFDYVIVTSAQFFDEIKKEAMAIGIDERCIISGTVFQLPKFDFQLYQNLIENPVTILSDDYWGRDAYNRLKLPFASPLINICWSIDQYVEFISDPLFYLNTELKMVNDGIIHDGVCPIGALGDGNRKVEMKFIHNVDFNEAKAQWDRRKQKINEKNLFVKMGFSVQDKKDEWLEVFKNLSCKKILVYNGDTDIKQVLKTERFICHNINGNHVDSYNYNDYFRLHYYYDIDLLQMLNGENNYIR